MLQTITWALSRLKAYVTLSTSFRGELYLISFQPYYQPGPVSPNPFSINSAYSDPTPYSSNPSAWALSVKNSNGILVFGAGLYSFFQTYSQACIDTRSCQSQILNIDSTSSIGIYSLSTVATTYQLSINGAGIINQSSNLNGFASTVTSWTRS